MTRVGLRLLKAHKGDVSVSLQVIQSIQVHRVSYRYYPVTMEVLQDEDMMNFQPLLHRYQQQQQLPPPPPPPPPLQQVQLAQPRLTAHTDIAPRQDKRGPSASCVERGVKMEKVSSTEEEEEEEVKRARVVFPPPETVQA